MISYKDWDEEVNSDNEERSPNAEKKVVVKAAVVEPRKQVVKDKHGEIVINTLEEYVVTKKENKETRGDQSIIKLLYF
jgi:hypothetical protein